MSRWVNKRKKREKLKYVFHEQWCSLGHSPTADPLRNCVEKRVENHCIGWSTPLVLVGSCLRLLGFPGGSVVKNPPAKGGDTGSIPGLGRSPGEGNGTPLLYSCLGNPTDRGAWGRQSVQLQKSQKRLSTQTATVWRVLASAPLPHCFCNQLSSYSWLRESSEAAQCRDVSDRTWGEEWAEHITLSPGGPQGCAQSFTSTCYRDYQGALSLILGWGRKRRFPRGSQV